MTATINGFNPQNITPPTARKPRLVPDAPTTVLPPTIHEQVNMVAQALLFSGVKLRAVPVRLPDKDSTLDPLQKAVEAWADYHQVSVETRKILQMFFRDAARHLANARDAKLNSVIWALDVFTRVETELYRCLARAYGHPAVPDKPIGLELKHNPAVSMYRADVARHITHLANRPRISTRLRLENA